MLSSLAYPNLYIGLGLGFAATLLFALLLNKFGNVMFRWGVAKPFFIGGRRLHHRQFLLLVLPLAYGSLAALILAGYVQIVWGLLWTGIEGTLAIVAFCLTVDLVLDYAGDGLGRGLLKHELIYLTIPAFVFSNFLKLAV